MYQVVGALWEKTTKDGMTYYSGVLRDLHGDINITVFPNNKKEKEKQPDFNIVLSVNKKTENKTDEQEPF